MLKPLNSILVIFTPLVLLQEKDLSSTLNSILVIFTPFRWNVPKLGGEDTLNSILVIFTRCSEEVYNKIPSIFKFHSGYIYTRPNLTPSSWCGNFKFHSGYIYTIERTQNLYFAEIFKFHSGYIYTNLTFEKKGRITLFKFHSGYIYTALNQIIQLFDKTLNSILVIFTRYICIFQNCIFFFKFHSGYIYT